MAATRVRFKKKNLTRIIHSPNDPTLTLLTNANKPSIIEVSAHIYFRRNVLKRHVERGIGRRR